MNPAEFLKDKLEELGESAQGLLEHIIRESADLDKALRYVDEEWEDYWWVSPLHEVLTEIVFKRLGSGKKGLQFPSGFLEHYEDVNNREPNIPIVPEPTPQATQESDRNRVAGKKFEIRLWKRFNDELEEQRHILDLATAHTWMLGDTLVHDLAPALSGAVDSLTSADIAFGEMDLGYDDLRWVSDDVLEGLTVNAAAMSGAVTPWAAGVSELVEQRRSELEAYRPLPRPGPRRDSPPGSGSSGGGLSWDEGLDLYQRKTGETAENIAWIRTHPDDKADSGENVNWTFRDIVRDAVEKSDKVPLFAMGGLVPGMVGTPVPAVVHGGEEIVGAGNGGGVPINLEVHVHGTVISEGDLAKNVRDGLMRRFD